ncbi:hypothetical protein GH5_05122 [Leishmania sp. Ghana 2012 LV757]|uniref:hypothetical protein n=1 Tax=Leishmania sp. Ghana 2012 LV757 TaxID=2803181 RepID=UPI001B47329D|nr:hypothetical protein GH5_05122 [Leishmania sp. Ghana 2012 LV757]
MAERKQPLPSPTRALAAAKPSLMACRKHSLDLNGLQRSSHDVEDCGGENTDAEEDAQTTREPHEHLHSDGEGRDGGMALSSFPSAATRADTVCLVSFTGFRDEDEWRESDDEGDGAQQNPLVHAASGHATPRASSFFVCEKMTSALPGVRVESKLTSSTTVLVARRGFTRKRLLAARRGIPVVLPRWVERGCPMLSVGGGACGVTATASASTYDLYAVPWLHGYVFSTTGLSTSEKAAIESVCVAHGAVLEPSLTYKCDVLLTSAECVQALQRLLNSDRAGDVARRRLNEHLRHTEVQRTGTGLIELSGADMATPRYGNGQSHAAWLTDKVRFALELDVPVVDYVKLFTMLRLDRLPPSTWTRGTAAPLPESSSKTRRLLDDDIKDSERQYADALSGSDFDAIVDVCRVGTPAGGSPEWARILSIFTMASEAPADSSGPQHGGGVAEGGALGVELSTPANGIVLRHRSLQSSSSSFTDSVSTVSDPDAWDDLLSGALASSFGERQLRRTDTYPGTSSTADANRAAGHFNGVTPTTATVSPSSQSVLDRLTVNTADVEDLAKAGEEPSTLHVSLPDYHSATTGPALTPHATFQWGYARREMLKAVEDADWGIAAVDPSPRLTTNALLHCDLAPPCHSIRTNTSLARAQCNGSESAGLKPSTVAYYAPHHSSEGLPPQRPHAFRPDYAAAGLSPAGGDGGALLAETQVLVESCVAADVLRLAPVQRRDACEPRALCAPAARHALPLLAMHPPFLTICVLGCTESELRKTVQWAAQCRLLRSPVPTSATDLVVLGSRILIKKRYTMRPGFDSVDSESGTKGSKKQRQQRPAPHPSAFSAWSSGENDDRRDNAGRDVAVSIRYWEMDAAVARALADACGIPLSRMAPLQWLRDAALDAQRAGEAATLATVSEAVHRSAAHAVCADGGGGGTGKCWSAVTTPLYELGGPLGRQPFHPLPLFSPDQLPDVADPKYYIRVRRVSAASWASSAAPTAVQGTHETTAGAALLGVGSLKWAKHCEVHHSARQDVGGSAPQPALSSTPSLTGKEKSNAVSAPVEEGDSLTAKSTVSVASVPAATASHAHLHATAKKTSPSMEDEQHSYEEALTTAERRFNQLVTLFRVSGDDDTTQGSAGGAGHGRQGRSKALEACYFCCVEGEYARVDWAVVRGLIRYGGGQAEKRAADDWQALLQQQRSASVTAAITDAQKAQQEQNLACALRRSVEYAKLRQKLLRVMRNVESARDTSGRDRVGRLSGCTGPAHTRADADEESAAEVTRLTAKLHRVSHRCQQAPALCLLPHSFQRAAADERGVSGAADAAMRVKKALPGRAVAGPVPAYEHLHPLHRLLAVTMDYVLACIAAGYCLNPHTCFLFDTSIPSAPDMRLFHHQRQQRGGGGTPSQKVTTRHTGSRFGHGITGCIASEDSSGEARKQPQANPASAGNGSVGRGNAPLHRPALSRWVLERRYSKTASVGVCISVLWRLPTPPATEGERCWSHLDTLPPPATAAAAERCLAPDASLVPLLRVLLLGLRNATEALGGHVADTFSPSAVTHVISVDVGGILSGTLRDAFTSDAVEQTDVVASSSDGRRPFPYWPAEGIEGIGRCAARDEVSLVGLEWLAACVQCGVFVDEAAYPPPPELLALVQAERQRSVVASSQVARRKQQQQPRQSSTHCHSSQRTDPVAAFPPANLTPASSLAPLEARPVVPLEDHRKGMGTSTRGGSETATPHTPPPPRLLDYGSPPDRGDKETEEHEECCTPVLRRTRTASATLCDSSVESCTPPIKRVSPPERAAQHRRQPLPPQPLSSPVPPPPPRPEAPSGPNVRSPSMDLRARSGGTPSAGDRNRCHHHRSRSSFSASQHNTRSLREQQDEDAYVEHLGDLFNFFSPGSTPLPSSARRWRERSTATCTYADAGTPQRLRNLLLPRTRSQSRPPKAATAPRAPHPRCEITPERDVSSTASSSQRTQVLAPSQAEEALQRTAAETTDSMVGPSHALSTPRRRTLRGAAAAATAAHTPSASRKSILLSPDRQRRRTEKVGVVMNDSVTDLQARTPLPGVLNALCDVECAAPAGHAPCRQLIALPNLLGGSTELSRDDTTDERAVGVRMMPGSCEEVNTGQLHHQSSGGGPKSVWASQTQDELGEREMEMPRGAATGTGQQHGAHKSSRVGGTPQDGSHGRGEPSSEVPPLSAPAVFSWLHDVIPDSQPPKQDIEVVACICAEPMSAEVLEPASFIAAAVEEFGPTPAAIAETAVGGRYSKDAATLVPAGEREEVLCSGNAKGASSAPDVIDAIRSPHTPAPPAITGAATVLEHKRAHRHPESVSAPRQPSPSPYPPPPSTTMETDANGGVSRVANAAEEKQRCDTPCAHTKSSAAALSPWSRHRPLSLSRRPSGSPAPALALVHMEPTAVAAGVRGSMAAATSCTSECLRIYVLHDLPHRAARVRRCEEALDALMRCRGGAELRPHIDGVPRTAELPMKDGGHGSTARTAPGPPSATSIPPPAPPLSFAARCEDADVLVTHEISLRESVLVAIAAGCWVVRPGFLECAAAVLDGFSWGDGGSTAELMRGRRPTLQLQAQRHPTVATAEAVVTASVVCVVRLREALSMYEWTAEALPRAATPGCPPQSDSMPSVQRALVQQCHRQRLMRDQAACGSVPGRNAGPRPPAGQLRPRVFEGCSFVLLSCSFTANAASVGGTRTAKVDETEAERCRTSARVRAIVRILESGGGHLCSCVQIGCTVAEEGGKADEVHETVTIPACAPLWVQPQLRCCASAPSPRGQWHQLPQRRLYDTPSSLVMDAALYHDLLWLICDQVRREPSETLFVLLEGSLLGTDTDGDHGGTMVYVSPAPHTAAGRRAATVAHRDSNEADSTAVWATLAPSEYGCASKRRRIEKAEMHNDTQPSPKAPSGTAAVAAEDVASSNTCTVAAWLSSWLLLYPDSGSRSMAGDETLRCHRCYAPAAAEAMRAHFRACCTAVRMPSSATGSYSVADLPFAVPSVEEVCQACMGVDGRTKARPTVSASRGPVRRIEFRSTGWVGACVAAGAFAAMATSSDAWVRACEAHTHWGTLFLE